MTLTTKSGKVRGACTCGRMTRAVEPRPDGQFPLADLAPGWRMAPYPPEVTHRDGVTGARFTCPACANG